MRSYKSNQAMMVAIKISVFWAPISILLFIVIYGGDSRLQWWQGVVSCGPVLAVCLIELISSLRERRA